MFEVDPSEVFADVVSRVNGSQDRLPQAILLGRYGGRWVSWSAIKDVPVFNDELRARGLSLGAGVVVLLPADHCGLVQRVGSRREGSSPPFMVPRVIRENHQRSLNLTDLDRLWPTLTDQVDGPE